MPDPRSAPEPGAPLDAGGAFAALARRVDVVLVRPGHAGNVGAAARALRVMGLSRLALVAPRDPGFADAPEAVAFASGATDVLAGAAVHADVASALAASTLCIAVSAAGREFAAPPVTPEAAARLAFDELRADPAHRVAWLFGNERTGLSIADAQRCQLLCSIPADPGYGSLNLAQAVQVVAYCLRREWLARLADEAAAPRAAPAAAAPAGLAPDPCVERDAAASLEDPPSRRGHARAAQIEAMLGHLERALVAIGFLDPASPKRLMPRLRRLFARTRLSVEEVDILRGIAGAMLERSRGGRDPRRDGAPRPASPADAPTRDTPR